MCISDATTGRSKERLAALLVLDNCPPVIAPRIWLFDRL
jgi:hypothetical protein